MSHFLVSFFPFHLGGKIVSLEVEVVDAQLDNKLSLGRSWTYAMMIFISLVFQILFFSHEGGIVIVDQMDFNHSRSMVNQGSTVPWIENSQSETESINVGMYPSLMGTFNFFHPFPIFVPPWSATKTRVPHLLLQDSFISNHLIYVLHGCYPLCISRLRATQMLGWICHCMQWKSLEFKNIKIVDMVTFNKIIL